MQTQSPRVVFPRSCVRCPAASYVGETAKGSAVRCEIEHSLVTAVGHGASLAAWCLGDYAECPTWRTHREAEWERRDRDLRDSNAREECA